MFERTLHDGRDGAPPGDRVEPRSGPEPTVVHCYDFFDRILPEAGFLDLTDGMYLDDPDLSYEAAQENQINWLLDQVECGRGTRLLDVGCGNGTLLAAARRRGAEAVGITISPPQVRRCRTRDLDARLVDYRDIDDGWFGTFDAVVANGSIEHFVQPRDAVEGRVDAIYRHLFRILSQVLDPESPSGKVATTVIHFDRHHPRPETFLRHPLAFRPMSDDFHVALLERCMGGFYPYQDQLARCAEPYFALEAEVDGTEDYRRTSEEWLKRATRAFVDWRTAPRILRRVLPYAIRRPGHALAGLSLLFTESWQWQFRGEAPPTRLLRQVWRRSPAAT